jgi:hypothetical protein
MCRLYCDQVDVADGWHSNVCTLNKSSSRHGRNTNLSTNTILSLTLFAHTHTHTFPRLLISTIQLLLLLSFRICSFVKHILVRVW